jgi:D-alanyl-D-alanine carboxypeptidase
MAEEARRHDIVFVMTTAYRSYEFQSMLYNNYVAQDGQAAADRYSAKPGHSEHQTGLAVDVSCASVNFELRVAFADTKEGKWLSENAHLFGFIIRFPEGKEEITGYQYEPWHLRYVGLVAAEYIYVHELTLEEYLELLNEEVEE